MLDQRAVEHYKRINGGIFFMPSIKQGCSFLTGYRTAHPSSSLWHHGHESMAGASLMTLLLKQDIHRI